MTEVSTTALLHSTKHLAHICAYSRIPVNWKAILTFHDNVLTINHIKLTIQDLHSLDDPKLLNNLYTTSTEPAVPCAAINRVTQILDATYKKASLPEVVNNNYRHLNIDPQNITSDRFAFLY